MAKNYGEFQKFSLLANTTEIIELFKRSQQIAEHLREKIENDTPNDDALNGFIKNPLILNELSSNVDSAIQLTSSLEENIEKGATISAQLEAVSQLQAFLRGLQNRISLLKSEFPGEVSAIQQQYPQQLKPQNMETIMPNFAINIPSPTLQNFPAILVNNSMQAENPGVLTASAQRCVTMQQLELQKIMEKSAASSSQNAISNSVESKPQTTSKRRIESPELGELPAKKPRGKRDHQQCIFCHAYGHLAVECEVFDTVEKRKDRARELHRCMDCVVHMEGEKCRQVFFCKMCQDPHPPAFCPRNEKRYKREH